MEGCAYSLQGFRSSSGVGLLTRCPSRLRRLLVEEVSHLEDEDVSQRRPVVVPRDRIVEACIEYLIKEGDNR